MNRRGFLIGAASGLATTLLPLPKSVRFTKKLLSDRIDSSFDWWKSSHSDMLRKTFTRNYFNQMLNSIFYNQEGKIDTEREASLIKTCIAGENFLAALEKVNNG